MPRKLRPKLQLTQEEKKERRREQKKISMRRARAKMSQAAIEERRRKDRERYNKKKESGGIKTIHDYTPRQQRQIRKIWREKAKIKREKEKAKKRLQVLLKENTPPSSPSFSRVAVGKLVAARNKRILKSENFYLKSRVKQLEDKLAKYRMRFVRLTKRFTNDNAMKSSTSVPKVKQDLVTKKRVQNFLLQDEHSRLTAGKKETVTRNKVKQQVRYLNDTLLNLHKLFKNQTKSTISYETFRKYRPFWVLFPKAAQRSTCLCALHTNTSYMLKALHHSKIISHKTTTQLLRSLCCNNELKVDCLERKCLQCKNKSIECQDYNQNDTITYERWVTKNVSIVIKGQPKICKKTVKETVHTTKQALLSRFDSNLPAFMQHVANNIHQTTTMQTIKEQMSSDDGLLHIDFSENYNCKYSEEIQSAHFGGSKPQLSLHTCVYYRAETDPPENFITTLSMCTVSEILDHDPVMICAHLPVINRIKDLSPNLKHLHVLSDGPTTQYRNKSMFQLMANYLTRQFEIETITWHFSEKGHGKGAPDGVCGCIKRVCDNWVARGNDVSSFEQLISCAKQNCKGIEVYPVDASEVPEIKRHINESSLKTFKGTLKIHQLTWSAREPTTLHARRLSCLYCAAHVNCPHYEIGQINVEYYIPHTSSTRSSPVLRVDHLHSPELQDVEHHYGLDEDPGTPDLPTVPNTPETPEVLNELPITTNRPVKKRKLRLISESSESSVDMPQKRRRDCDSDNENIF